MTMDRESVRTAVRFLPGNAGESAPISTARYAWQSIHLPTTGFVAGNLTWEVWNETTETFVDAVDFEGAPLPAVAVTAGMVVPVDQHVNYARVYRISMAAAQPDDLQFHVINKT